jgi:hypothetical protein
MILDSPQLAPRTSKKPGKPLSGEF